MFNILTYGFTTILLSIFIYIDGPRIVKNNLQIKYNKFRRLNKLVSTNYKGCFKILYISLCMIITALKISLWQKCNGLVVQSITKSTYNVSYVIKGITYTMIIKPNRGPRKILMVLDETHTDVSDFMFPYIGPSENFNGQIYTPIMLSKNKLIFILDNGTEIVFEKNDKIIFKR
jgi:hypothetical protein